MDVLPESEQQHTMLQAWCTLEDCPWRRIAMPDTARGIELAGYAHMKEKPGHAVTLNFTPRRTPTVLELIR